MAILIALVLYVNEIPDRAGDGAAGKRTLPVRLSKESVIRLYVGAVVVTYGLIAFGSAFGIIARLAILALATIPMAVKVTRGPREYYHDPYALMPTMATIVQLHAVTGLVLLVGYGIAIVTDRMLKSVPGLLR